MIITNYLFIFEKFLVYITICVGRCIITTLNNTASNRISVYAKNS